MIELQELKSHRSIVLTSQGVILVLGFEDEGDEDGMGLESESEGRLILDICSFKMRHANWLRVDLMSEIVKKVAK